MKRIRVDDGVDQLLEEVTDQAESTKSAVASEALLAGLEEYCKSRGLDWEDVKEKADLDE